MIYCAIDKAFDNHLTHNFDNYAEIDIKADSKTDQPAFYTAQGGYSAGVCQGTTIGELKKNIAEHESMVMTDSSDSFFDYKEEIKPKKVDHAYYIEKFVKNLVDSETNSMASSNNNSIYKHVKSCKFCKNKVNERLRDYYAPKSEPRIENEHFSLGFDGGGYDIKELIIIILGGIFLIFILDLLVKIGKKMH
jgi:hypothetical protein